MAAVPALRNLNYTPSLPGMNSSPHPVHLLLFLAETAGLLRSLGLGHKRPSATSGPGRAGVTDGRLRGGMEEFGTEAVLLLPS